MSIRIVIVDDHPAVRMGIRRFLKKIPDIEVVGEAGNGTMALELVDELKPDMLLLDVELPDIKGFEVAKRLHEKKSQTKILAISAYSDRQYILGMLTNGAAGYLVKDDVPDSIHQAIQSISRGTWGWLSPIASQMLHPSGPSTV